MSGCNRLNAAVERIDELVSGPAAPARVPDDCRNARQHVFDAVVEFGAQQILALFGLLAPRDIAGEALDAYKAADRIEFRPRGFLEPYLPAVGANETKGDRGGTVDPGP